MVNKVMACDEPNMLKTVSLNEEDSEENKINPWVVKHKFPIWWICLITIFGNSRSVMNQFQIII